MKINQNNYFCSFALDSAYEKVDVWNGFKEFQIILNQNV